MDSQMKKYKYWGLGDSEHKSFCHMELGVTFLYVDEIPDLKSP